VEFTDRRTGQVSDYTEDQDHLQRAWGSQNLETLFPEKIPKAGVPFPMARRQKSAMFYDPAVVREELQRKPNLVDVDPRMLKSTQPNITRAGVQHYMGEEYRRTGQTFADRGNLGNQFPFVYSRKRDHETEHLILAGHHRAAAALLQGKPLRARRVEGPPG
jgi:hypothetical protein